MRPVETVDRCYVSMAILADQRKVYSTKPMIFYGNQWMALPTTMTMIYMPNDRIVIIDDAPKMTSRKVCNRLTIVPFDLGITFFFLFADYSPSKQALPFLPKSPKCLKPGHLAKVISKNGRVVIGRVRYVGILASSDYAEDETFVGLQLPNKVGDCDGSINGRKFFDWYISKSS